MSTTNVHDHTSPASPNEDANLSNLEFRKDNTADVASSPDAPEEKPHPYYPKKYTSATVAAQRAKITVLAMLAIWAFFSHFTTSIQSLLSW